MLNLVVAIQSWISGRRTEVEERGATAVEYALVVSLIAMAIVVTVDALSKKTALSFNRANAGLG